MPMPMQAIPRKIRAIRIRLLMVTGSEVTSVTIPIDIALAIQMDATHSHPEEGKYKVQVHGVILQQPPIHPRFTSQQLRRLASSETTPARLQPTCRCPDPVLTPP